MQSIWSESWKSSEFITTKIAFTSRSVAALQENDLANRYPPMPSLTTTLGGTIAAVCFRCQSQRNYEFAMDRGKSDRRIWLARAKFRLVEALVKVIAKHRDTREATAFEKALFPQS